MVVNKILADTEERMKRAVESTRRELATIRTGKASPALLDTVRVEAYGQAVPLQQVGTVAAPEVRLLVVQPWDKSLVKAISKAIQQADLGLNPTDDGTLIRVPIPTLTEERRKDMVKLIAKLTEEGRVHVRQVRHDINHDVKQRQHEGEVSEDEGKRLVAEVQKLTDRYVAMLDDILKKKTAEVMEV
jgi:ribosome recycling factor